MSRLLENPKLYNVGQALAGVRIVDRYLSTLLDEVPDDGTRIVLDAGGGTGISRSVASLEDYYICADTDAAKLVQARRSVGPHALVQTDATASGVRSQSIDLVLCKAVSHHISEESLGDLFAECRRLLKYSGWFVFLDAVWAPRRLPSRILWSIDRGSNPRTPEHLISVAQQSFEIVQSRPFRVIHEYVAMLGRPLHPEGVSAH